MNLQLLKKLWKTLSHMQNIRNTIFNTVYKPKTKIADSGNVTFTLPKKRQR
jgi:hypothetical protein